MLKTIKTTKKLRLDELIKYCIENNIVDKKFYSSVGVFMNEEPKVLRKKVEVYPDGNFNIHGIVTPDDLFVLEEEEEIEEHRRFSYLVEVYEVPNVFHGVTEEVRIHEDESISRVKKDTSLEFHALIHGRLQLIWEREKE